MKKLFLLLLVLLISCTDSNEEGDCDIYGSGADASVLITNNGKTLIIVSIEADFSGGGRGIPPNGGTGTVLAMSGSRKYNVSVRESEIGGPEISNFDGIIEIKKCTTTKISF